MFILLGSSSRALGLFSLHDNDEDDLPYPPRDPEESGDGFSDRSDLGEDLVIFEKMFCTK